MRSVAAVLCLVSLLVAGCAAQANWQGVWTDSARGGLLYTCVDNFEVFGTYSDVGYVQGVITEDGNSVEGIYIEAGYTDFVRGEFKWTLSDTGFGFTGIKTADDRECAPSLWSELLVNTTVVTKSDCIPITPSRFDRTILGRWTDTAGNVLSVCQSGDDDDHYEASFETSSGARISYHNGQLVDKERIGSSTFHTLTTKNAGIELFLLSDIAGNENGTVLTRLTYATDSVAKASFALTARTRTTFTRLNVTNQTQTNLDCARNRDMFTFPFEGAWTDIDFGTARMYTCLDSTNRSSIHGVYSELGWINGIVSEDGNSINGTFYDAGTSSEVDGFFKLNMDGDKTGIKGFWVFSKRPNKFYRWKDDRISTLAPTASQCQTLTTAPTTVAGRWSFGPDAKDVMDICIFGTRYEASYSFDKGVAQGYMRGFVREGGKAMQGEWFENNKQGIEMLRLTGRNALRMSRWPQPDIQIAENFICDDDEADEQFIQHRAQTFTNRLSLIANRIACGRNRDLTQFIVPGPFTPPSRPRPPPTPSTPTTKTITDPFGFYTPFPSPKTSPRRSFGTSPAPSPSSPNPSPSPSPNSSPNPSPNPSPNSSPSPSPNSSPSPSPSSSPSPSPSSSPSPSPSSPSPSPNNPPPFFGTPQSPNKPRAPPPSSASSFAPSTAVLVVAMVSAVLMYLF